MLGFPRIDSGGLGSDCHVRCLGEPSWRLRVGMFVGTQHVASLSESTNPHTSRVTTCSES